MTLDPDVTSRILDAAAQALGNPWESRYGCPDCADQGAYHLEVTAQGTVRETDIDPMKYPTFFDPLIEAFQAVIAAHPGPTSICVLNPANCKPDQVSLVLGLGADGTLTPTWYNDLDHSIYLPGCATVTFERLQNGEVTWSGQAAQCGWVGDAHALGFADLWSDVGISAKDKPGTYRATGMYYLGCTWGKPVSEAACTGKGSVTSNSIEVAQ